MKAARLLAGVLGFGVLMALRAEVPNLWLRMGLAGLAAAWLVVFVRGPRSVPR